MKKQLKATQHKIKTSKQLPLLGEEINTMEEEPPKRHSVGITRENILALDVATKTGFCCYSGSGVWNFTTKKDESKGMRLIRFRAKLLEIIRLLDLKLIVFEGAASYSKFPNFVGPEMQGVLKLICEEHRVDYQAYVPSSIKKFATGKGNAGKPLMIETAQRKYNVEIIDDNHADAIHLYNLALYELGLMVPAKLKDSIF